MNEPMNYPDVFWRRWTGLTYKISQASWNPQNLNQSSVQILLDPGWLFKWTGSLMVCTGIFTMFYLKPYFNSSMEASPVSWSSEKDYPQDFSRDCSQMGILRHTRIP